MNKTNVNDCLINIYFFDRLSFFYEFHCISLTCIFHYKISDLDNPFILVFSCLIIQIAIGIVVALNYHNPFLNPYEEFQVKIFVSF